MTGTSALMQKLNDAIKDMAGYTPNLEELLPEQEFEYEEEAAALMQKVERGEKLSIEEIEQMNRLADLYCSGQ